MSTHSSPSGLGALLREVVARRALVVGAVTAALHFAVQRGWVTSGWSDGAEDSLSSALDLLGAAVAILWARAGVTPADPELEPRDQDGRALIPADDVAGGPAVHLPPD